MSDLIQRADSFAEFAHEGQKRKYTGDPYILHPRAVAAIVAFHTAGDPEAIAAALLHDVVEDTDVTLGHIEEEFGATVAEYVDWLTDKATMEMGNRAMRKAFEAERIAKAPPIVKTIKLADLIDNTKTIVAYDKSFAKVYLAEKARLLIALEGADELAMKTAKFTLSKAQSELHQYLKARKG